jgi:hypothetical protein
METDPSFVKVLESIMGSQVANGSVGWLLPVVAFFLGAMVAWARRQGGKQTWDTAVLRGVAMPTVAERRSAFYRELERVRRYERTLSVLVAAVDEEDLREVENGKGRKTGKPSAREKREEALRTLALPVVFARIGQVLRDGVRDIDVAACDVEGRRYVILMPELSAEEGRAMARRLSERVLAGTGVNLRTGVAEFRRGGLLVEDLVEAAAVEAARCPRLSSTGEDLPSEGAELDGAVAPSAARASQLSGKS